MKVQKKHYWKGLEQLSNDPEFVKNAEKEFPEFLPIGKGEEGGSSRRDFLKMMGFSLAAASLAACEAPVRKAIPYVNQPEDINPGVPNYYASTYINKGDYCSIVVKTREGRPIKIEGNDLSSVTQGGVTARVEASILNLYDVQRLKNPLKEGSEIGWGELDADIISALSSISARGGSVRIVSNTIISPTTQRAIQDFIAAHPNTQHVMYDAHSVYGITRANELSFGQAIVPSYDFSRQEVVVSFGADFLGTWISPVEFVKQYSKTRKLGQDKKDMSRHYQFESLLTLTGANADYRTRIKPSQEGLVISKLYNLIAAKAGAQQLSVTDPGEIDNLGKAADDLWAKRGRALVVSGSNDPDVQQVVNRINALLGAYENGVIDLNTPIYTRRGNDEQMHQFMQDAIRGNIDGVIFFGCNPVYDHPLGGELKEAASKISLRISTADRMDETTSVCNYVAPNHHFLESWNDAEPKRGRLSLMQPAITPLFNTRQEAESILRWSGSNTSYYDYLRNNWQGTYFNQQTEQASFDAFWDHTLYRGVFDLPAAGQGVQASVAGDLTGLGQRINARYKADNAALELVIYEKVSAGTGDMANNPWLQEMADPITRVSWDNYITIPQDYARELGLKMSEGKTKLMNVSIGGKQFSIPVVVQPGQASGTLGIAMGYGRKKVGPVGDGLGVDIYPFVQYADGVLNYTLTEGVEVELTGETYTVAQIQTHHTYMGRETIIQEATLQEYQQDPYAGRYMPVIHTSEGEKSPEEISLWDGHHYPIHHWGMVIDLNSCIGCGACTIACQVENNVPVVGRNEVMNRREMHWLRIDRYYSSDEPEDYKGMEKAAENPEVIFQPMLCQHCNNAPCETVCPVAATTHSSDGLNQMAYNRCIGTRYCANNCPYKVRRFNWFKYFDNKNFDVNKAMYDDLGKMVLNPDVTVRSRGVMEKCTFCVQRIQLGKLEAKKERRSPKDGEIVTACAKACPADAIVFGDMNDLNSRVAQTLGLEQEEGSRGLKATEPRAYNVLMEINTKPNIFYLTKIKNKDKA